MGFVSKFALAAALTSSAILVANPALAGCKRMGFTVNDYGKDGPTKDAQDLLDKHITSWAAEQGIEKFTVGKKDVSCELFLNLIVVDEHTCTASATVCWGGDSPKEPKQDAKAKTTPVKKEATAAAGEKSPAKEAETKPAETPKAAEAKPAETPKATEAPKAAEAKPADTAAPVTPVETGTIPVPPAAAATAAAAGAASAVEPAKAEQGTATGTSNATTSQATAAAEAAAAAAERAAAAAERAALAAERAANALTESRQQAVSTPPASSSDTSTPSSTGTTPATASASAPVAPITPTP